MQGDWRVCLPLLVTLGVASAGGAAAVTFSNIVVEPDGTNVLRYRVSWESDVATSSRVAWREKTTGFHYSACTVSGTVHAGAIWGLRPSTSYRFRIEQCGGTSRTLFQPVTTGALPGNLPTVSLSRPCVGCDARYVLFDADELEGSTELFIVDSLGTIVWYETEARANLGFSGAEDGDGVLWIRDYMAVLKKGFDGTVLVHLTRPGAGGGSENLPLDRCYHHEIYEQDGEIHLLTVDPFTWSDGTQTLEYMEDGVSILSPTGDPLFEIRQMLSGIVADEGILPPDTGNQTASDFFAACDHPDRIFWGHGNTLIQGPDGSFLVNLRDWGGEQQGQVLLVDDLGTQRWALGKLGDFELPAGEVWFNAQHHVQVLEYGEDLQPKVLLVFDNRGLLTSRVLDLELAYDDVGAPDAVLFRRRLNLGKSCSNRGSAFPTASDHVLVSCASDGSIAELPWGGAPGGGLPLWEVKLLQPPDSGCTGACVATGLYRAVPLETIFPFD